MLYKMELLKKLFKKLGKQHTEEKEAKSKTMRFTTTIAMHDLENKRRKAIEYLKQNSILKVYMKVNIYDNENVEKGRLMLMNMAEDLKEYAKVKVSPMDEAPQQTKQVAGGKKPTELEDIKRQADASRLKKGEVYLDDGLDEEGLDGMGNFVYMELQSTVAFKEVDIDEMLQHTTLDDFLRGLYIKAVDTGKTVSQHDKLLSQLMNTRDEREEEGPGRPKLEFEDVDQKDATVEMFRSENLK